MNSKEQLLTLSLTEGLSYSSTIHEAEKCILNAMEVYRKQGNHFTPEEIESIKEEAYQQGYNADKSNDLN